MRAVLPLIDEAAAKRAGVLISGEDGTGRQVAARAIHVRQSVSNAAFVTVNCAAYDTEELDLFL